MLLLLGGFLLLMLLGLPVALSMAVSSLIYILVTGITPDVTLAQRMIVQSRWSGGCAAVSATSTSLAR